MELADCSEKEMIAAMRKNKLAQADIKASLAKRTNTTATVSDKLATDADTTSKYANLKVTNMLKVAWSKFTAFAMANPWLVGIAAGALAIFGIAKAIDLFTTSMEEASEATTNAISELSSITSEVESLESKLSDLKSQIDGLDHITDEEDIRRLEAETLELENQLAILKEKERLAKEDADEKAQESLGKTQVSRYNEPVRQSRTDSGYVQETFDGSNEVTNYHEVTREEELKNAMNAYDEYYKQKLALEEELAGMRATDEGYAEKQKAVDALNQQMKDARTHASELALALDEEKAGLSGTTAESKALLDSTNATLSTYSQWLNGINSTTNAINKNANAIDNATASATKFTKTQMIDTINSMADGFDVLDDIYADVLDGGTFDFTKLDTSKFSEAFSEITPEYEKFIETVSASPTDIEACQGAFNDLVSAFIDSKGILDGLTEENKDLTISMLQNMGVANAKDIVTAQLAMQTEALALQEQFATERTKELTEATYAEINGFLETSTASDEAKYAIAQLAIAKIDCNNASIDASSDIENLLAIAKTAGFTSEQLLKLESIKSRWEHQKSIGNTGGAELLESQYKKTLAEVQRDIANYNPIVDVKTKVTPKYSGADQTASAIDRANKSASDSAKDAAEEAKKAYSDWFDFMDIRVEKLDDAFANLEKGMENVVGAFAKNQLVDAQLGIVDEEINNYTDALAMYKQQAQNVLSTIEDADLRDKIVNGAVELSQIQGENADVVKSAMEAYQNWSGKIAECNQKLEELRTQIRQLELAKFENIIEDYTNQFDLYGDSIDLIKGQIGLLEEAGELVGKNYYTTQITQSEKQLATLEKQKADMIKQMTDAIDSGRIQRGTDEWLEMQKSLSSVESEIIDVKTNIEELNNDLQELNWSIFERVHTEFGNLNSELENLAGLFDDFNDIKVSDGKGNWTDEAISTLGLYMQQYELARYQANSYSEAIDKLNEDFQNGDYSATEYMDKLASLKQEQWNCVESVESLESAIVSLNKTRIDEEIESINKQVEAYEELIQAQIDALDAEKD